MVRGANAWTYERMRRKKNGKNDGKGSGLSR